MVAEGVGFEPTGHFRRPHALQACALNHSATPPVLAPDYSHGGGGEPDVAPGVASAVVVPVMIVGRIIALLFLGVAAVALAADLVSWVWERRFAATALGQRWFDIHSDSLGLAQAVIQRYVWPFLWDPIITTILRWPAWAVFAVPGLVLWILFRRRRRRVHFLR